MVSNTTTKLMENKKQTAVDWLKDALERNYGDPQVLEISWEDLDEFIEQAKQMERERRKEDFKIGYNQGYLDCRRNHVNDADNFASEQDYVNQ